jgi:hypothetical protein
MDNHTLNAFSVQFAGGGTVAVIHPGAFYFSQKLILQFACLPGLVLPEQRHGFDFQWVVIDCHR